MKNPKMGQGESFYKQSDKEQGIESQQSFLTRSRVNYWQVATLVLLLIIGVILGGGGVYHYMTTKNPPAFESEGVKKTNKVEVNQEVKKAIPVETETDRIFTLRSPSYLIFSNFVWRYPKNWIPVFANSNNEERVIYFATSKERAKHYIHVPIKAIVLISR